jgi:hypothetical protein
MNRRTGTFEQFKERTLAVARGEREINPNEPKIWCEPTQDAAAAQSGSREPENSHYVHSVLRERIVEHVFVGQALQKFWNLGARDVEVLRSEFDAGGYDLVMTYRKTVRHIQFKSILEGGKAASVNVSLKLMEKPSGCVIVIAVSPKELELKSYRWFGGLPGHPLPNIIGLKSAKYTKGNAQGIKLQKPNHRIVPLNRFEPPEKLDDLLRRLFGPLP